MKIFCTNVRLQQRSELQSRLSYRILVRDLHSENSTAIRIVI